MVNKKPNNKIFEVTNSVIRGNYKSTPMKLVGCLSDRPTWSIPYDVVGAAFMHIHLRASHSNPTIEKRWKKAEKRMIARYCVYLPRIAKRERL